MSYYKHNLDYPYLGSDEERKQYVLYFNKILSDGHVHIKENKYIKDYLNLLV
jgi:hypothetical protein